MFMLNALVPAGFVLQADVQEVEVTYKLYLYLSKAR